MGLFSRREKVELQAFCRDFYDKYIFNPVISGVDAGRMYAGTVIRLAAEADESFSTVDIDQLAAELMLIRFEAFALAWMHQFRERHAAAQSAYTKSYLEEKGRIDVWESLTPYNQAVARSTAMGMTSKTPVGRAHLAMNDHMRTELFDEWLEQGFALDVVGMAANRTGTRISWERGFTAGFLMLTLCHHLGGELNEEAQNRLIAVIRGFYDGARETMKRISVEV